MHGAASGWGWGEPGNGLAVARDHDAVAALHGSNEFGKAIFGFGDAHVHNISSIARFSGHINPVLGREVFTFVFGNGGGWTVRVPEESVAAPVSRLHKAERFNKANDPRLAQSEALRT